MTHPTTVQAQAQARLAELHHQAQHAAVARAGGQARRAQASARGSLARDARRPHRLGPPPQPASGSP